MVRSWPVAERDGIVFVWHDASGASPDFEIASVPEIGAGWLHRTAVMGFQRPQSRIPFLPRLGAEFFRRRVAREVARDAHNWQRKAFQPRPALSEAGGPIVALRTWLSRFYEVAPSQQPRLAMLDG